MCASVCLRAYVCALVCVCERQGALAWDTYPSPRAGTVQCQPLPRGAGFVPVERGAVKQETPSVIHQEREGAWRAYDRMSLECSEKAFNVVRHRLHVTSSPFSVCLFTTSPSVCVCVCVCVCVALI